MIKHKCKKIAQSIFLEPGREYWIGKITETLEDWPLETHCLHIKTPAQEFSMLLNRGDLEQLIALLNTELDIKSLEWLKRITDSMRLENKEDESSGFNNDNIKVIVQVISEIKKTSERGEIGHRKCPVCGGVLNYSKSSYNGHIRITCETDGCLFIME